MIDTAWNVLTGPALLALQNSGSSSSSGGPSAEEAGILAAVGLGILAASCCAYLVIQGIICFFAYTAAKKVPQPSQLMSPGLVWLMMIPIFNYFWNFMVFMKVPKSIKAALDARGIPESGDCGAQMGLFYSIACVASIPLSFIPFVGLLIGVAALVLLIISLIQMNAAAKKLV